MGLDAAQWLAPYFAYSWLINGGVTITTSLIAAVGSALAMYPAMLVVALAAKWLIIGRYKPGSYPLWGTYYFRWWLSGSIQSMAPIDFLSGTPLLNVFLRLMGARIGRNVHLATDNFSAYDTLTIGDGSTLNADATALGYTVQDGYLNIGAVRIGRDCVIGARAVLSPDTTIEDNARLADLSLLPSGTRVPANECWLGSPAQRLPRQPYRTLHLPARRPAGFAAVSIALYALASLLLPMFYLSAIFPGMIAMTHLDRSFDSYWFLMAAPVVAASFIVLLCGFIVGVKWLLLGRVKPGKYPLNGGFYLRKWFVDGLMDMSLDVMGPLYATLYLAPWFRALGAKLGRNAEISTACDASPDLLDIGAESFIADAVLLGAPHIEHGYMTLAPTRIGKRAFIGNSALVPAGSAIGDNSLIGVLSTTPSSPPGAARPDTSWLGSPAIFLPQRPINQSFSEETTFRPTRKLYAQRYAIELWRITLPVTGFVLLTTLVLHAVNVLREQDYSFASIALFFPLLYLGGALCAVVFVIVAKWLLVGRCRPCEMPLWSPFVWRTELVTALHENLAGPLLIDLLHGTPWAAWFFRLMGAKIGRRVFLNTTCLTEYDLIHIGDDAALNLDATLQTHLFEDRVMKMSTIRIGAGCSAGALSVVLYDAAMEPGSKLGELSLLMKGESLPANTEWQGTPARRAAPALEAPQNSDPLPPSPEPAPLAA